MQSDLCCNLPQARVGNRVTGPLSRPLPRLKQLSVDTLLLKTLDSGQLQPKLIHLRPARLFPPYEGDSALAKSNTDNSFARSQERARNKNRFSAGPTEPTVDDQLTRLEDDIRRLKIEFDMFFNGASKRAPYDTKGRVDTMMKRIADDRSLTFAQRYRFNSLGSRYNCFRDLWRRTLQGREEGRDAAATARAQAKQQAVADFKRTDLVCEDAHKDVELVKELYSKLVEAKKVCGEPVEDFSFPRFHRLIASQADGLKERVGCERVSFSIDVEGGRVSFKARAERD